MKVAFISNSIFDGAGIAANRIANSVKSKGVEVCFFTNDNINNENFKTIAPPSVNKFYNFFWKKYYWHKYRKPALQVLPKYEYFTVMKLDHGTTFNDLGYTPDVIHLHWINNVLDYGSFFSSVPANIPIVWTLHDMSAFTGGCIYSWDCNKFVTDCSDCPQLPLSKAFQLPLYSQKKKIELYKGKDLHVAAASFWLQNEAKRSYAFKNVRSLTTIHYSIDQEVFRPEDKLKSKRSLNITDEKFVICFGATYLASKRKGLSLLLKALQIVYAKYKELVCIVYGSDTGISSDETLPPIISVGKITSENDLRNIYSAADIFVIPSLQENLAQTCLESMACGTPVVGFDVGGIPDMVIPERTGALAIPGNVDDLAKQITWMIEHPDERKQMGLNARKFIEEDFSMDKQGEKYIELYRSILSSH